MLTYLYQEQTNSFNTRFKNCNWIADTFSVKFHRCQKFFFSYLSLSYVRKCSLNELKKVCRFSLTTFNKQYFLLCRLSKFAILSNDTDTNILMLNSNYLLDNCAIVVSIISLSTKTQLDSQKVPTCGRNQKIKCNEKTKSR